MLLKEPSGKLSRIRGRQLLYLSAGHSNRAQPFKRSIPPSSSPLHLWLCLELTKESSQVLSNANIGWKLEPSWNPSILKCGKQLLWNAPTVLVAHLCSDMPPQIPTGEVKLVGLLSPSLHMHGPQASQVHHTLHLLHKP